MATYRRANALMLLVARSTDTPSTILDRLSHEDDPELLENIAENPNTPTRALACLAKHSSVLVRTAVCHNINTPRDILMDLTADDCVDVRYAMAANPLISSDVLHHLLEDENPYVHARAMETINRLNACDPIELPIEPERRTLYWKACYRA